jgi:hypothetical protein
MRFEVLIKVKVYIMVFRVKTTHSFIDGYQYGTTWYHNLEGHNLNPSYNYPPARLHDATSQMTKT